jgi:dTDP-4-dehydrorhamnose reductase
MTVLILGAGGQVGSALRWRALARGASTVGLAHRDLDIAGRSDVNSAIEGQR